MSRLSNESTLIEIKRLLKNDQHWSWGRVAETLFELVFGFIVLCTMYLIFSWLGAKL